MLVRLVYFKETGKYYSEGTFESVGDWWDDLEEVRRMIHGRRLPGLVQGHSEFYVFMQVGDSVPHLLLPSEFKSELSPVEFASKVAWEK